MLKKIEAGTCQRTAMFGSQAAARSKGAMQSVGRVRHAQRVSRQIVASSKSIATKPAEAVPPPANLTVRREQIPVGPGPPKNFMAKVKAAWQIFFPPKPENVSAREAGKTRLRMILVADRCGLNQASMHEMRHSIVRAVSDYVEIEAEDMVEVNISTEPEMGTVYSVAVPVRRVRPQARSDTLVDGQLEKDGVTLMWDDDPEDRFPYGC